MNTDDRGNDRAADFTTEVTCWGGPRLRIRLPGVDPASIDVDAGSARSPSVPSASRTRPPDAGG
ncbi:hypothetical protein, partial [Micrococcus lylae]|uniref:hypothetical protein n=1 Tax=Micrococcus lylae TaxID=1273 RepID=UPI0035CCD970